MKKALKLFGFASLLIIIGFIFSSCPNSTSSDSTNVKQLVNAKTVSLGYGYTMVIDTNDNLWAWGANNYGQLGDGTTTPHYTPVKVGDGWQSVSTGGWSHTVGIKTDGSLWAWGANN